MLTKKLPAFLSREFFKRINTTGSPEWKSAEDGFEAVEANARKTTPQNPPVHTAELFVTPGLQRTHLFGEEHPDRLLQFFAYQHLPPHLAEVSKPFSDLAHEIVEKLPANPERTVALRKLLEAKDCAVRAVLYKGEA